MVSGLQPIFISHLRAGLLQRNKERGLELLDLLRRVRDL